MTALQYFGFALAKIPYMGVGRNFLYKKSLFNEVGGFSSHNDTVSGDDDLFLQDVITKVETAKIGLAIDQDSYVPTWSLQSWKDYFNQKRRHASTSMKYTLKHQFLLSLWAISHIAWMAMLLVCAIGMGSTEFALVAIIFWILATILHYKSIVRLEGSDLMKWFPILDIGLGINYIIVAVLLIKDKITKRQAWT
jgi:cellulose synthase/poly-beta-1,6-N-acetylglucosamine synthase-like glycosyltransferase